MQIQASNWQSALQTGIVETDGKPATLGAWFVDVGDRQIRITDPESRRTFRVKMLDQSEAHTSQIIKALTGVNRAVKDPSLRTGERAALGKPIGIKDKATGVFQPITSVDYKSEVKKQDAGPRVLAHTVRPTDQATSDQAAVAKGGSHISETALEDVFLEITEIFEKEYALEDAIDFVLKLTMKYLASGTVGILFASDAQDHLYFAAAEGDGKKKLLKGEFDIKAGIPAVCLRTGTTLAIPVAEKDARNTTELAEKGGISVRTMCAAPVQAGDRGFGVLLLINRKDREFFSQYDANVATYIGSQLGKFVQDQLDAGPLE